MCCCTAAAATTTWWKLFSTGATESKRCSCKICFLLPSSSKIVYIFKYVLSFIYLKSPVCQFWLDLWFSYCGISQSSFLTLRFLMKVNEVSRIECITETITCQLEGLRLSDWTLTWPGRLLTTTDITSQHLLPAGYFNRLCVPRCDNEPQIQCYRRCKRHDGRVAKQQTGRALSLMQPKRW